ncbi:hypothetical protein TSUD_17120 [Trifolium subterraneum]|uniref:Leucine-rich repeat-containing N-terminal plant-type domain-containing protein n=1 Tax=Trifolium subterraneum TaxID=3900 RepID=A0A2Z6NT54_TRISU|nr:hypothetical protein TSUD_17120 [Trifolium subterraneum]
MLERMKLLPKLCLVVFYCMFVMATSSHSTEKIQGSDEANALLKWKASFDNQSKALLSSWNIGNNHCNWMGITCDVESKSIYKVNLVNIGLKGRLRNLTILDINSCYLTGTIPISIGMLAKLSSLKLYNNSLLGHIPREIGKLVNLKMLYLGMNSLYGFIPREIGFLKQLGELDLSDNHLSGTIPSTIGNLSNLYWIIFIPIISRVTFPLKSESYIPFPRSNC